MKAKKSAVLISIAAATLWPGWLLGEESDHRVAGSGLEKPTLELTWLDHHRLFTPSKRVAKEVQAIFHELGVVVDWKENDGGESSDDSIARIRVVLTPSEPGGAGWRINGNAMGVVVRLGNERIEAVYIFFKNVMRCLGHKPEQGSLMKPAQRRDLGRALGRVVAHEVVHALAPSAPHAFDGLMDEKLNHAFLQKFRVPEDSETKEAVIHGLALLAAQSKEAGVIPHEEEIQELENRRLQAAGPVHP